MTGLLINGYTVGEQKTFLSFRKILSIVIMCYYVIMLVTMLLNGHTVNSSVICYTSSTFATILFCNI